MQEEEERRSGRDGLDVVLGQSLLLQGQVLELGQVPSAERERR
jgi:hypothetical protein